MVTGVCNMDLLTACDLSAEISVPTRMAIINEMFSLQLDETEFQSQSNRFDAYFRDWFEEKCEAALGQVQVKTLRQLVDLVVFICGGNAASKTKGEIKDAIRSGAVPSVAPLPSQNADNEATLDASIDLAACLWLMLSIGTLRHSLTPGRALKWENEKNLVACIGTTFHTKPWLTGKVKLPKVFTAVNLETIGGIRVAWTSNLADHLNLTEDDTKLTLFHQVSFLQLHKASKSSILSPDFIDETFQTLGLLIPSTDPIARKRFSKKQVKGNLDPAAGSFGPLNSSSRQIEKFHYWRDRLIILKQAFDESEPGTMSSWWYDDRRKVQWYTFWIAALVLLLTIIFGLIQSVSGVVSAWAAVRSMSSPSARRFPKI